MHESLSAIRTEPSERSLVTDLIVTARPKQWIKNGFVFAALIFASKLAHVDLVFRAVAAFVLFSGLSSAVYFLNDAMDVEADRQHPLKSSRPIAAGRVPVRLALVVSLVTALLCLGLSFLLDTGLGLVALGYIVLQL